MERKQGQPEKNRQSTRLKDYDYSKPGIYFITSCTKQREPFFNNATLQTILVEQWHVLHQRFPSIALDQFVIMPDHIHGLIILNEHPMYKPTVSQILNAYKSITSVLWLRYIKENNLQIRGALWQRSFHDHIVRDEQDLQNHREYIINNPFKDDKNGFKQ